jgi:hypothetical protein
MTGYIGAKVTPGAPPDGDWSDRTIADHTLGSALLNLWDPYGRLIAPAALALAILLARGARVGVAIALGLLATGLSQVFWVISVLLALAITGRSLS